jgi:hypothetical protein
MNCFLSCPHHFHEEYVLKNKPNIKSDAMQNGIEFHDFANHFFDHVKFIDATTFFKVSKRNAFLNAYLILTTS